MRSAASLAVLSLPLPCSSVCGVSCVPGGGFCGSRVCLSDWRFHPRRQWGEGLAQTTENNYPGCKLSIGGILATSPSHACTIRSRRSPAAPQRRVILGGINGEIAQFAAVDSRTEPAPWRKPRNDRNTHLLGPIPPTGPAGEDELTR